MGNNLSDGISNCCAKRPKLDDNLEKTIAKLGIKISKSNLADHNPDGDDVSEISSSKLAKLDRYC